MKLLRIEHSNIDLEILDKNNRKYATKGEEFVTYFTDMGVIRIKAKKDTWTDGRSGGWFGDLLLPNIGGKSYRPTWFGHDCSYTMAAYCESNGMIPPLSYDLANELFKQALCLPKRLGCAGLSEWRANLAYKAVSTYFGRKAYDTADITDLHNAGKISITRDAK